MSPRAWGSLLCVASAVAYGAVGVFAKLAYREGLSPMGLLALRFTVAAVVLWALAWVLGERVRDRRAVMRGLAIGAVVYAGQAGLFFAALAHQDAALTVLLVYVAPPIVAVAAVMLGRERPRRVLIAALPIAMVGIALVAAGAGLGRTDPWGVVLSLACAVAFATYMLTSHAAVGALGPVTLAACVCTGSAVAFVAAALVSEAPLSTTPRGWVMVLGLAIICSVLAVTLLAAGTARVGPTAATLLSTVEPVTGTILAVAILGEHLAPVQVLGGALVVVAAVMVSGGVRWWRRPRPTAVA